MPLTRSAIKKMRQDERRTAHNRSIRTRVRNLLGTVRKSKDGTRLPEVYSLLDRAAKTRVIHPRAASRLKSRIAKVATAKPYLATAKAQGATAPAAIAAAPS